MCKTWPIIVTYRRPALLRISLMRLAQQNLDIAEVVVVDNSPADDTRATSLSDLCVPWMIKELPQDSNLGPAGGYAVGMEYVLKRAGLHDFILLLDDNDPLPDSDILGPMQGGLRSAQMTDPSVAGVGARGGRYGGVLPRVIGITNTGQKRGSAGFTASGDLELADHLPGGGYPMYVVNAVRSIGPMQRELFFGFEELEFGLRLTEAGHKLLVDLLAQSRQRGVRRPGLDEELSVSRAIVQPEAGARRYYSLRNYLWISMQRRRVASFVDFGLRGFGRPLLAALYGDWNHIVHNLRLAFMAGRDAAGGRLGRTFDDLSRCPLCAPEPDRDATESI